jgi:Spy/CpxP family protein refolding chaperone
MLHPVRTLLVALVVVAGAPILAQARPPGPPPGDLVARHAERLGLSSETLDAIRAIVAESAQRDEQIHGQMRAARHQMRALLSEPTPDEAAVMSQAEAIGALEVQADQNRLGAIMRIRALLTPEQRTELIQILKEEGPPHGHRGPHGCRRDLAELCPDAAEGPAALRCLGDHWDSLSPACRAMFGDRHP